MNTDIFIIITAVSALIIFLVFHWIIFRYIAKHDAIRWFAFLLAGMGIGLFAVDLFITGEFFIAFVATTIYALAACGYFMGVFGLLATSVRIRLLTEIAEAGEKGLSLKQLEKRYNVTVLIGERLARFVSSGDIAYANGYYVKGVGVTFFTLPAFFLYLMKILYGTYTKKT